ncbi:biotin--[acetyl-CoA-carboxylase] ligase [Synechococcus sp. CS-1325]|uniref:biotin--[acetyl-CoA-carboxylase] ligase n=1 Tax=Synechococcus sp. CS-1325 TaxID=2847979 RepID=UPI000DAFF113|nr:biotin--[acetyl-CoA-carboxylase] ligase [Synechococcus sp. CS-1325]MCT0198776.1 biotin--[acetyl-CoA-carboxylase] ligase [Synechococcus sp. CS-1325]PZU96245.1 MAG: biotin--[acetyl-CoA-carboxylase] ligase [Cyanobium sp.]
MIGAIAAARRRLLAKPSLAGNRKQPPPIAWQLHGRAVCASSETVLDRLLGAGARPPLAVFSRHQRFGHGQQGRPWLAPAGGVWLSAALPWAGDPGAAADLGLAAAVGLALQLEDLGLAVAIKWPNDLLVDGRKLAGLLPRLRLSGGRIRWARVGLGLNGSNRVPAGAISVAQALGRSLVAAELAALAARALCALDWAAEHAGKPETVLAGANQRLRLPAGPVPWQGELWQPLGLNRDGSLAVALGERRAAVTRSF